MHLGNYRQSGRHGYAPPDESWRTIELPRACSLFDTLKPRPMMSEDGDPFSCGSRNWADKGSDVCDIEPMRTADEMF